MNLSSFISKIKLKGGGGGRITLKIWKKKIQNKGKISRNETNISFFRFVNLEEGKKKTHITNTSMHI